MEAVEPQFIRIYCAQENEREHSWRPWRARETDRYTGHGHCYASKRDGAWRCLCCGKPVSVIY